MGRLQRGLENRTSEYISLPLINAPGCVSEICRAIVCENDREFYRWNELELL